MSAPKTSRRSPRDCYRSERVSTPCSVCGERPQVMHMPMNGHGFFCEELCRNCQAEKRVTQRELA
jgi:hypothetical protein